MKVSDLSSSGINGLAPGSASPASGDWRVWPGRTGRLSPDRGPGPAFRRFSSGGFGSCGSLSPFVTAQEPGSFGPVRSVARSDRQFAARRDGVALAWRGVVMSDGIDLRLSQLVALWIDGSRQPALRQVPALCEEIAQ